MAKEATKNYMPEQTRLCVREDGMLCMANTMGINASMGNAGFNLRPYPGDVTDSPEVVMKFLRGNDQAAAGGVSRTEAELGRFNFDNMSRTELCEFAMDEWGHDLTGYKTAHRTREIVIAIKANGGKMPAEGEDVPAAVVAAAAPAGISGGIGVKA